MRQADKDLMSAHEMPEKVAQAHSILQDAGATALPGPAEVSA
jgi:hypothetical protein